MVSGNKWRPGGAGRASPTGMTCCCDGRLNRGDYCFDVFDSLDFKVITSLDAEKFGDWEEAEFKPEADFLAKVKEIDGVTQVETQTFTVSSIVHLCWGHHGIAERKDNASNVVYRSLVKIIIMYDESLTSFRWCHTENAHVRKKRSKKGAD